LINLKHQKNVDKNQEKTGKNSSKNLLQAVIYCLETAKSS